MVKPNEDNISEALKDMKKFKNSRSGMDKVLAIVLGKAYDALYFKQSKFDENKQNVAGNFLGDGFGIETDFDTGKQIGLPKKMEAAKKKSTKTRRSPEAIAKRVARKLARFIALRYNPKAIAKYQDYAGRLRRSKRLIKQIVKIDDATYRIKGYIIKTDTAGNNPYSCTCADFSQFSTDARNWLGSAAGPFNPCKHMMAVRDRGSTRQKWKCLNGICSVDPSGSFNSKADCEASRVQQFTGGQELNRLYRVVVNYTITDGRLGFPDITDNLVYINIPGPVLCVTFGMTIDPPPFNRPFIFMRMTSTTDPGNIRKTVVGNSNQVILRINSTTVTAKNGLPDTGGNPPVRCADQSCT